MNSNATRRLYKCYRFSLLLVGTGIIIPSTYYACAHNKDKAKELVLSANNHWVLRGGKIAKVKVTSKLDIVQFNNLAKSSNNVAIEDKAAFEAQAKHYLAKIARRKERERQLQERLENARLDLQMV